MNTPLTAAAVACLIVSCLMMPKFGAPPNPRNPMFMHASVAMIPQNHPLDFQKTHKNAGSDYRPEGCPDKVNVHDFVDQNLGKAVPYGVYDIAANAGCVSVGID